MNSGTFEKAFSGAAIGALLGGAYGCLRAFLSQPGYIEKLQPRPECFEMDCIAAKTFYELQQFKHYDEECFISALRNMDSLFCLEMQLNNGDIKPNIKDPLDARGYSVRCLTYLRRLRDKIPQENIYNVVMELIKAIERVCTSHLGNIELIVRRATQVDNNGSNNN